MDSNSELVDYLLDSGYIESERVEKAFRNVDRALFTPEKYRGNAYEDKPIPIGENATISAPHIVAINTELLEVGEGDNVLEIGSGSGYQAAILSKLAQEVTGIEILYDLAESSRKILEDRGNVEIIHGDGFESVDGSFDKVLYSAATVSFDKGEKYLEKDGILVAPVKQNGFQILKKYRDGKVTKHGHVRFVEMI